MDVDKYGTGGPYPKTDKPVKKVLVSISVSFEVTDVEDGMDVFQVIKDALIEKGIYSNQISINMQESQ
jgi:hypothetical protein